MKLDREFEAPFIFLGLTLGFFSIFFYFGDKLGLPLPDYLLYLLFFVSGLAAVVYSLIFLVAIYSSVASLRRKNNAQF